MALHSCKRFTLTNNFSDQNGTHTYRISQENLFTVAGELERLAGNVKRVREGRRMSQRALAAKAHVAHPTVLAIEQARSPNLDTVLKLAAALDVRLWELLGDVPGDLEELLPGWNELTLEQRQNVRRLVALVSAEPASSWAELLSAFGSANAAGLSSRQAAEVSEFAADLEALSDADDFALGDDAVNHPNRATGSFERGEDPRGGSGRPPRKPGKGGR